MLDLACGTGLVTYLAATQVGSSGFVTGMDLSPGLLQQVTTTFVSIAYDPYVCWSAEQAEAKKAALDLDNISFLEGDIEIADSPSSFDAILCSQAIFYFDMHTTAKKLRAWLKPGGLLAYNTLEVA